VYVRVSLLQQNKVLKTKRTEVVRRSVSPSFNESFTFRMSQSVVDVSSVSITVMQRHNSLLRGEFAFNSINSHNNILCCAVCDAIQHSLLM